MLAGSQTGFCEAQVKFIYLLFSIWLMWKEPQPVIIKILWKRSEKERICMYCIVDRQTDR